MRSNSGIRSDLFTRRSLNETLVTDFFGGVAQVQVTDDGVEDAFPEEPDSVPTQHAQAQQSTKPDTQPSTFTMIPEDDKNLTFVTSTESPAFLAETLFVPTTGAFGNLRAWCGLAVVGSVIGLLARS